MALLRLLTRASGRPVTWLALFARIGLSDGGANVDVLCDADYAIAVLDI